MLADSDDYVRHETITVHGYRFTVHGKRKRHRQHPLTGPVEGLRHFLEQAKKRLSPAILITDCTHPRADTLEASQLYCDRQIAQGRYEGERKVSFEYKGEFGPWFNWLAISPEVLTEQAKEFGFNLEVIYSEVGRSLCVLSAS